MVATPWLDKQDKKLDESDLDDDEAFILTDYWRKNSSPEKANITTEVEEGNEAVEVGGTKKDLFNEKGEIPKDRINDFRGPEWKDLVLTDEEHKLLSQAQAREKALEGKGSPSDIRAAITREQFKDYKNRYYKYENELLDKAMGGLGELGYNRQETMENVDQAFNTSQDIEQRRRERYGVTDDATAASERQNQLNETLSKVGALNASRDAADKRKMKALAGSGGQGGAGGGGLNFASGAAGGGATAGGPGSGGLGGLVDNLSGGLKEFGSNVAEEGRSAVDSAQEETKELASEVAQEGRDAVDSVQEEGGEFIEDIREGAISGWELTQEALKSAEDKLKGGAKEFAEGLEENAVSLWDRTKQGIHRSLEQGGEAGEKILKELEGGIEGGLASALEESGLKDVWNEAQDVASETVEGAKDLASKGAEEAQSAKDSAVEETQSAKDSVVEEGKEFLGL